MLTVLEPQPESLRDEALPVEVRELPADSAAPDVSLTGPNARPVREGKIGRLTECVYVRQSTEPTERTKTEARGLPLPTEALRRSYVTDWRVPSPSRSIN